jgi:CRISPR-associated protein Csb2
MNHLGRAESLVEAALLPEGAPLPPGAECVPCAPGEPSRGPGWEQVSLLLPCPAEVYAHWREARVAEVLADPTLNPAPGRKATAALEKKRQKALAPYPEDLLACLVNTTSKLQAEGWSQPPGSQRVLYWRRDDALEVAARTRPRPTEDRRVEAVLLALSLPSGNLHALPPVTRALPQAELFHRSAVSRLGRGRPSEAGAELVGLDLEGVPLRGHRHAHVFPLDLDGDGHLDHLLVWAPGGLGREAVAAIRGVRETWTKGGADALRLAVAATGGLDALRGLPDPWGASLARLLGPARRWISLSPFVPPRHLKRGGANRLDGQVRAELASRGHPEPLSVGLLPAEEALARGFRHHVLARGRGGPPPPAPFGLGLEIRFTEPLRGPLCLGYGSHFGLGLMVAVPED